jgi:hypothetical protein
MGTIILSAVLVLIVSAIIGKIISNRKKGRSSCSCGCECSKCNLCKH